MRYRSWEIAGTRFKWYPVMMNGMYSSQLLSGFQADEYGLAGCGFAWCEECNAKCLLLNAEIIQEYGS